jgi:hypothetical protein
MRFSRIKIQTSAMEIDEIGDLSRMPKVIPMTAKKTVEI